MQLNINPKLTKKGKCCIQYLLKKGEVTVSSATQHAHECTFLNKINNIYLF